MKQSIRRKSKLIEIGGIGCACCTPFTRKKTKKIISKIDRRKIKQDLKGISDCIDRMTERFNQI